METKPIGTAKYIETAMAGFLDILYVVLSL